MEAVMAAAPKVLGFLKTYGSYISLATSTVSAFSQQQSGQMQGIGLRLQASQAELQGRQNALNYNRQALQVLRRQEMLASTVRARAASGGIDPFTGSPLTIQQIDMMKAQEESEIARQNAQMAIYGGLAQSQSLQAASMGAESVGAMGAIGSIGKGISQFVDIALPRGTQAAAPVRDAIPVSVG
jgi:hypothetical protein